jgi:hypothetical protein
LLTAAQTLTNKTLTTPTIGDFSNAAHDHEDAAGGGQLSLTTAVSGILPPANGGTGVNNDTRALAINTNSGTLAFGAASKTLTINENLNLSGASGQTLTLTNSLTVQGGGNTVLSSAGNYTLTVPETGTAVLLTATQTLTNKTLTTPTIGDFSNAAHDHEDAAGGGQLSLTTAVSGILPSANGGTGVNNDARTLTINTNSGTLAFGAASKTLTINENLNLSGASGQTLTLTNSLTVQGGGNTVLSSSGNYTLTIPETGTAALLTAAQTLTNKTLTTPTISNFTNATHDHEDAAGGGQLSLTTAVSGILPSANGGTGVNNGGRTLTINTNSGTLAFGAASKTLTINENLNLSGASGQTLTLTNSLTVQGGGDTVLSSSGNFTLTIPKTGTVPVGTGTAGRIAEWVTDANTVQASTLAKTGAGVLTLAAAGAYTLTIPATGTVPVGTGTAGRVAEWVTDANTVQASTLAKTGAGVLTLAAAGAYTLTIPATGTAALLGTANVFTAAQAINGNLTVSTNALFVDSATGDVGIGTTSPNNIFHVELPSGNSSGKGFEVAGGSNGYFRLTNATGNLDVFDPAIDSRSSRSPTSVGLNIIGRPSDDAAGHAGIRFSPRSIGSSALANADILQIYNFATHLMTINASGNVGIGETSPTAQLQVEQTSATGAKPTLRLQQADLSEEFIRFDTTVGAGNPINTSALGSYYGRVRVWVEGVGAKWLALYNA